MSEPLRIIILILLLLAALFTISQVGRPRPPMNLWEALAEVAILAALAWAVWGL